MYGIKHNLFPQILYLYMKIDHTHLSVVMSEEQ